MAKYRILTLVFLAVILMSCQRGGVKDRASSPKVGKPAPTLSLPDLAGNNVSIQDLKGKVVLLNFWSYT